MQKKERKNLNIMAVLGEHSKKESLYRRRGARFFIQSLCSWKKSAAFTLMELLIVIGITIVLAGIGISSYVGQQRAKLLESTTQEIVGYLRYAQQKSIAQEQGEQWGIHFENPASGNDFYALYTGTTYSSSIETRYLPSGIIFTTPATENSVNVSFNKLTGTNYSGTSQSLVIQLTTSSATTTISVSSQGLIAD